MNRSHLWKFLLVIFVIAWALYSQLPWTGRDVIATFQERASRDKRDATFTNILQKARELQQQQPNRAAFANLKEAVGTNDITRYFPFYNTKDEKDPSAVVLHRIQRDAAGKVRLGLDLQGGISFLVAMDTSNLSTNLDRTTALGQAVEVLRKRVDRLGVAEPIIQPQGSDRILIQLPGLSESDREAARRLIEAAAFLEFRMVHPESDVLLAQDIVEPGYEVLTEQRTNRDGTKTLHRYLVKKGAERNLTGKHLKRAIVTRQQFTNEPEIDFELDPEGAKLFGDITREWSPKGSKYYQLAIVLDGVLYSAPRIMGPIEGGRGQITGSFTVQEAFELANVLENPLEAPVKIIQESTVDPSLGRDSISSGVTASIAGAVGTFVFMLVFYFFGGLVANVALALNVLILMGVMASMEATLSLPGIAGIALTIGMAVDANVLIFERMREEFAAGKSLRAAVAGGYGKAFGTIFDSNLTTIISAMILYFMGTGPVKGFGLTLTIGVCASMFTALLFTRLVFDFLINRGIIRSVPMLPLMKTTKFDFLKWGRLAFITSWALAVFGIGYGITRGNKSLGVDFIGGDKITLRFTEKVEVDSLRASATRAGATDSLIQYQRPIAATHESLEILVPYKVGPQVAAALTNDFPQAKFQMAGIDNVGPMVGKEIQRSAIVASLLALFGILVYVAFRYEFSFAIGAVIAVLHDVALSLGLFFLAGGQLSATVVAAVLTIIGYSTNDKIVNLDRIREDLKLGVRGSFRELINLALNQTLSRTIITGGAVLLATLALYLFGGGVIKDFAFVFLVGTLAGTYSSIFIACPIVLWWNKGERPKLASAVSIEGASTARA